MDATHTAKLAELLRRDRNDVRAEIDFSLREILEPDEIERAGLYEGMDPSLFAMRACVRIHELEELLKKEA